MSIKGRYFQVGLFAIGLGFATIGGIITQVTFCISYGVIFVIASFVVDDETQKGKP